MLTVDLHADQIQGFFDVVVDNVYASPVAAADRIYIVDLDGAAVVLRRGDTLDVLAQNRLEDSFAASPAIVGDTLLLRGERFLYCIGRKRE